MKRSACYNLIQNVSPGEDALESAAKIAGLFQSPVGLESLLDNLPVPVAVLDRERRVIFMNSAFELLSGCARDQVRGVPCRDVLRANVCLDSCPLLRARECNAPVTVEANIINRERRKITVRLTAGTMIDEHGKLAGYVETVEDMSDLQGSAAGIEGVTGVGNVIGMSPRMRELFRLMPVVAQTGSSVLLTGETGTGKDVLAELIHNASDRCEGAFVKINCGALPETLLESELFGHKRGAFTGAVSDKLGRLRMAHDGTLFLTEIGDLPLPLQVKLLTFLDDKHVYPLGSTSSFHTDVRIIAATHRNLEQMVRDGRFRQDLLFRLNVVHLHVPPLRERDGDVALLLEHFQKLFSSRFGKPVKRLSRQARELLLSHSYPGNVRELRNIVEYATSFCTSETIGIEHLPPYLLDNQPHASDDRDAELGLAASPAGPAQLAGRSGSSWAAVERQLIVDTLVKVQGRRGRAAELLGWGRTTLWRKMKQYGI
jgi:PAS domain S-box-containing protein